VTNLQLLLPVSDISHSSLLLYCTIPVLPVTPGEVITQQHRYIVLDLNAWHAKFTDSTPVRSHWSR